MKLAMETFSASINRSLSIPQTTPGVTGMEKFGGPGSGFFGHKGRLGTRGGAAPLDDVNKDRKPFFSRERKAMGMTGASSARIRVAIERSYTDQTLTVQDKEILQVLWPGIHGDPGKKFIGLREVVGEEKKNGDSKTPEVGGYPKPPVSSFRKNPKFVDSCSETNRRVGVLVLRLYQCQANYHCAVGYY